MNENVETRIEKHIVIDVNPYRTRVVLLENGRAAEIYSEQMNRVSLVGNIFRGRVKSILPGMAAAFIDIGEEKNAFFSITDLVRHAEATGEDLPRVSPAPLTVGQELMVQIIKDAYGTKGARVSTQISLSGHLLVLFPTEKMIGISRNISDEDERERLKSIITNGRSEELGVIIRTAAEGRSEEDILSEFNDLAQKWHSISKAYRCAVAPKLIHSEFNLLERAMRDLFRPDVSKVTVNDRECYELLRSIAEGIEPGSSNRVSLAENELALFDVLGIEKQIDEALARKVWLKSGAYIVIDPTEALVSIDVNSGKNIGRTNLQQTALATNCEAAKEIARQLRLRDIGGIIIIDFIDLENKEDRITVVRTLREAMKLDRTTAVVHGMTSLGLVEVTRKKLRENLHASLQIDCPCCSFSGRVLSPETVALKIRSQVFSRILHDGRMRFEINACPSVIHLLKEHLKEECARFGTSAEDFLFKENGSDDPEKFEIRCLNN